MFICFVTNRIHSSASQKVVQEVMCVVKSQGKTLGIAEVPQFRNPLLLPKDTLNELAIQHFVPPREFVCLSNTGLNLLVKLRPIDLLVNILQHVRSQPDTETIEPFIKKYNPEEVCCMLLMLACQTSFPNSISKSGIPQQGKYKLLSVIQL